MPLWMDTGGRVWLYSMRERLPATLWWEYSNNSGEAVGQGTFTIDANASKVDQLSGFITSGSVPERCTIAVFGTQMFSIDRFVGNTDGGFGELTMDAEAY